MTPVLNQLTHAAGRVAELESQLPALRAELDGIAGSTNACDELWRKVEAAGQYCWAGAIPAGEPR
ncbi:MAG: hypothetical protein HY023_03110 [Chloroflexi bacterium]|nr:hypothetical protein [Chloroflexota bacterium]